MAQTKFDYDIVIRGGRVIDGTRMPAFFADIAIKDGVIAAIGDLGGRGREEIDAKGLIVAPGVIDIHTHYEAQLSWDPYASQSCWHGVTSIVVANCGFGFAPCRPEDRERAMRRMTRVEAIPYDLMKNNMRWDWVSQREQLESFERQGLGINVGTYIPHSVVRAYVLGEEDNKRTEVTGGELEQMKDLVRDGYRAGALGLSLDFNLIDRDYDGAKLPSCVAGQDEIDALVSVAREFNVGSIEVTPPHFHTEPSDFAIFERLAEKSGRPVNYNALLQSTHAPDAWKLTLELLTDINQRHRVYGLAVTHRLESLFNLINYNLFDDMPHWNKALACPYEQQLVNLRDPEIRQKLQFDLDNDPHRVFSGDWKQMRVFESEQNELIGRSIASIAQDRGIAPLDAFLDVALAEELRTTFHIFDHTNADEEANKAFILHPYCMPGLSDGGAHTAFLCLGKYPTVILSKWVRDEKIMSLEEAHWRMSYMSAAAIGLEGVGTLEVGKPADVIVYDLEKLGVIPEETWEKEALPNGGHRYIQKAVGYRKIIVNGVVTFEDGVCTGKLPGRVLRTSAYVPASQVQSRTAAE